MASWVSPGRYVCQTIWVGWKMRGEEGIVFWNGRKERHEENVDKCLAFIEKESLDSPTTGKKLRDKSRKKGSTSLLHARFNTQCVRVCLGLDW